MPEIILSDYFYSDESEEFVFFKIPRQLITNPKFNMDAKRLYGMLSDRMSLSARNKAMKLLAGLDTKKGVGLIERIKQGQGKPTKIYVKRFTTRTIPADPAPPPRSPLQLFLRSGFSTSESQKTRP